MSGNHVIGELEVADSFVDLSGQCRIGSFWIGSSFWRGFLHKGKPVEESRTASVSIEGDGPFVVGSLSVSQSSFLDIKKAMTISNDWQTLKPKYAGLVIDAPRAKDLWRLWSPSVTISKSTLKASRISLDKGSSLALSSSTLTSGNLRASQGAVIGFYGTSTLHGIFQAFKDSFLLFEQSSQWTEGAIKGLGIASLVVDEPVLVDATISIRSSWIPGDEAEMSSEYQKLFKKQHEFVLLKAKELNGRASLQSQLETQKALNSADMSTSYFEKFVQDANKKLALQHDYNAHTITLKLVDADTKLDKDGCLPDIGAYKQDAYKKLLGL